MANLLVVAVDGSPADHSVLTIAGRHALFAGARVIIVCTIDAAYALKVHGEAISKDDETEYPAAAREELAADKIIQSALLSLQEVGVDAAGEVLVGTPARAIVAAADRLAADMIVIGHRHLSWFDRMLHPSTCWDVLEHASCPVLVSVVPNPPQS